MTIVSSYYFQVCLLDSITLDMLNPDSEYVCGTCMYHIKGCCASEHIEFNVLPFLKSFKAPLRQETNFSRSIAGALCSTVVSRAIRNSRVHWKGASCALIRRRVSKQAPPRVQNLFFCAPKKALLRIVIIFLTAP